MIAFFEVFHSVTNLINHSGELVAHDEACRTFLMATKYMELAVCIADLLMDCTQSQMDFLYIPTAKCSIFDFADNICWILNLGTRPVFEFDLLGLFENNLIRSVEMIHIVPAVWNCFVLLS